MRLLLPDRTTARSDLFAGIRVLAGLGVSFATVAGAAAGPGKAPLAAVCVIVGSGLVFGVMLFCLIARLSAVPLTAPEQIADTPPATRPRVRGARRASGPVAEASRPVIGERS